MVEARQEGPGPRIRENSGRCLKPGVLRRDFGGQELENWNRLQKALNAKIIISTGPTTFDSLLNTYIYYHVGSSGQPGDIGLFFKQVNKGSEVKGPEVTKPGIKPWVSVPISLVPHSFSYIMPLLRVRSLHVVFSTPGSWEMFLNRIGSV